MRILLYCYLCIFTIIISTLTYSGHGGVGAPLRGDVGRGQSPCPYILYVCITLYMSIYIYMYYIYFIYITVDMAGWGPFLVGMWEGGQSPRPRPVAYIIVCIHPIYYYYYCIITIINIISCKQWSSRGGWSAKGGFGEGDKSPRG